MARAAQDVRTIGSPARSELAVLVTEAHLAHLRRMLFVQAMEFAKTLCAAIETEDGASFKQRLQREIDKAVQAVTVNSKP